MTEKWNSRLSYLDAGDIDDERVDFDGLNVLDTTGQKLGKVDGFIVDRATSHPLYVAVDSGGWFSSRTFLVPIGHARLDVENEALKADIDKSVIERFPEYDRDRFPEMSDDQIERFNERTLQACCPTELKQTTSAGRFHYDQSSHYAEPDWWQSSWIAAGPAPGWTTAPTLPVPGTTTYDVPTSSTDPAATERVTARDRTDLDLERPRRDRLEDGRPDERAQPGDVLGIEHAGETTSLGDTGRDERKRLEDEEEAAAKQRREERKDRR